MAVHVVSSVLPDKLFLLFFMELSPLQRREAPSPLKRKKTYDHGKVLDCLRFIDGDWVWFAFCSNSKPFFGLHSTIYPFFLNMKTSFCRLLSPIPTFVPFLSFRFKILSFFSGTVLHFLYRSKYHILLLIYVCCSFFTFCCNESFRRQVWRDNFFSCVI